MAIIIASIFSRNPDLFFFFLRSATDCAFLGKGSVRKTRAKLTQQGLKYKQDFQCLEMHHIIHSISGSYKKEPLKTHSVNISYLLGFYYIKDKKNGPCLDKATCLCANI